MNCCAPNQGSPLENVWLDESVGWLDESLGFLRISM